MEHFIHKNLKLQGRCIAFSYYGSVLLKKLFKENKMNYKVQVKRYIICPDADNITISPYHYYIEIKNPKGKLIIDNDNCYNYWFYMDKFSPRGTIEKVSQRQINKQVKIKSLNIEDIEDIVKSTILYHFDNIKKI